MANAMYYYEHVVLYYYMTSYSHVLLLSRVLWAFRATVMSSFKLYFPFEKKKKIKNKQIK